MRKIRFQVIAIATFFFLLTASKAALAAERVECGTMKSRFVPTPVGYCAMLPPSYDAQPDRKSLRTKRRRAIASRK